MSKAVLSVTQVSEYIRSMMDHDHLLSNVVVRGEISNYKVYPSGHHYFTLKDDGAALRCVLFRNNALRIRFRPENGMQIIAMGKISLYPRDGAYQLYCVNLIPEGVGDLHVAFEQTKAKLAAAGLFDPAQKVKIPEFPETVGIVTSSAGAAVHDMLRILRKRCPLVRVRLFPVRVQGAEAPGEIASAIAYANRYHLADVLIVGRGGGSIEDLWAFNDEQVAYAIYNSKIPIISAVGHEPDVTIADYVADLRAATPSNGAELAVQDQNSLRQRLDSATESMIAALDRQIKTSRQRLRILSSASVLQTPATYIEQRGRDMQLLQTRLANAAQRLVQIKKQQYLTYTSKLDAMSPLKVLSRGFSVAQNREGEVIRSVSQLQIGQEIEVHLADGSATACVSKLKENGEWS